LKRTIKEQQAEDLPIVVHLIPPHLPYYCKEGREFLRDLGWRGKWQGHCAIRLTKWGQKNGFDYLQKLYRKSLKQVMKDLSKYVTEFEGKVIISSDHGECIGKYTNVYGHACNLNIVRYVPWLEVE